jgi:Sulfotransferase family
MLLSMHIPKTAGTSFRMALQAHFGDSMLMAYRGQVRAKEPIVPFEGKLLAHLEPAHKQRLAEYCREHEVQCIHGHYTLPSLLEVFPGAGCITFVREPVDRLISAYNHLHVTMPDAAARTSFEQFTQNPRTRNVYEQVGMLECVDALTFIGITEQYERSLRLLEHKLPQLGSLAFEEANVSQQKRFSKADVTAEMRSRLRELNDGDVEIYEAALECFEHECAEAGL